MALALTAVLALGGQAAAQEQDDSFGKMACVYDGVGLFGGDGANSYFADALRGQAWDPLELMDTDPSPYEIEATVTCSGVDMASENKNEGPQAFGPVTGTLSTSGVYHNLVCGVGDAGGQQHLSVDLPGVQIRISWQIKKGGSWRKFRKKLRVQEGHVRIGGNTNAVDQGGGLGVATITPTKAQGPGTTVPCVGGAGGIGSGEGNVTEFTIQGSFMSTFAGEGASTQSSPLSDSDA